MMVGDRDARVLRRPDLRYCGSQWTQAQYTHVQYFVVKEVVEVCLQAPWLS